MLFPFLPLLLSFIFISSSSFLLVFLCLLQESFGLKVTGLVVPSEVNLGNDVQLECHYDLEGSNLYALKWYKGSHEFYRFVWKEVPPVSTFPWADVVIHTEETWPIRRASETDAGRVLLKNVTSAVEGIYKCEVSSEAPTFDTDYRESTISIVEVSLNQAKPVIRWLNDGQIEWQVNDILHFRCDMNGTRPASQLSWLVNGQEAAPETVDNHETPRFGRGRYHNSRSDLRLHMEEKLLTTTTTSSSSNGDGGSEQRSSSQVVVVTCISRVGQRKGVAIESQSEWIVSYHHHHQQQQQQLDINDDVASSTQSPDSKKYHNRTKADEDGDGDDVAQDGPIALSSGRSSKNVVDVVVTVGSIISGGDDQHQNKQTTNKGVVRCGISFISLLSIIVITVNTQFYHHNFSLLS